MTTLGERCVAWSEREMALGSPETLGPNRGPRIKTWLSICMRRVDHGSDYLLGITEGSYCAAFACFGAREVSLGGEAIPHGPRAAAHELYEDARINGTWHGIDEVRAGTWVPDVGDLAILARDGHEPLRGEEGHVGRVRRTTTGGGGGYQTLDANHQNTIALVERSIYDADIRGFVSYAQPVTTDRSRGPAKVG